MESRAKSDLNGYTTGTDRTDEEDKEKRNPKYPGHRTRIEEVTLEPMDDGSPSVRWAGITHEMKEESKSFPMTPLAFGNSQD